MLANMLNDIPNYGAAYSNWLDLYSNFTEGFFEVAISGKNALSKVKEINQKYIPNKLICGNTSVSSLPLLENRYVEGNTLIYVCVNKTCQLPTTDTNQAFEQIKNLQK